MTLNQALEIINSRKGSAGVRPHFLVCGFQPLHLGNLLRAHLMQRLPATDVEVLTGLYGDLPGNIELATRSSAVAAALVLEWADIDPRLGLRASAGWSSSAKADILASLADRFAWLEAAVTRLAARMPVALMAPSLPLPPIGNTSRAQKSLLELHLEASLSSFLARIAGAPGVRVVPSSPPSGQASTAESLDVRMELMAGFPYTIASADAIAHALAAALWQDAPKKGLITDLDDTLWAGIVGEVGIEGVSWSQEHHTQIHGLYQQMLGHLASCGVLLAVASKNDSTRVAEALQRKDLLLDAASLFPVHANWGPKSVSIAGILRTWNINADSVVFVDDSPMELDEVRAAFPSITCLNFPRKNPAKAWDLLATLRDLFGKPNLTEEDSLRQASIRASAFIQEAGPQSESPEFLKSLNGVVTIQWAASPTDQRPLELINKTNQFNLNGLRISEGEWQRLFDDPERIVAVVSYADKFGSLGKIAVLVGTKDGAMVRVSHWVMSCRAFSRKIELHTLQALFALGAVEEIEFALRETDRNQPLREFFAAAGILADETGSCRITKDALMPSAGVLPHEVKYLDSADPLENRELITK